jgi:hypothetical protein
MELNIRAEYFIGICEVFIYIFVKLFIAIYLLLVILLSGISFLMSSISGKINLNVDSVKLCANVSESSSFFNVSRLL